MRNPKREKKKPDFSIINFLSPSSTFFSFPSPLLRPRKKTNSSCLPLFLLRLLLLLPACPLRRRRLCWRGGTATSASA